jgi:hypothetical protein
MAKNLIDDPDTNIDDTNTNNSKTNTIDDIDISFLEEDNNPHKLIEKFEKAINNKNENLIIKYGIQLRKSENVNPYIKLFLDGIKTKEGTILYTIQNGSEEEIKKLEKKDISTEEIEKEFNKLGLDTITKSGKKSTQSKKSDRKDFTNEKSKSYDDFDKTNPTLARIKKRSRSKSLPLKFPQTKLKKSDILERERERNLISIKERSEGRKTEEQKIEYLQKANKKLKRQKEEEKEKEKKEKKRMYLKNFFRRSSSKKEKSPTSIRTKKQQPRGLFKIVINFIIDLIPFL